MNEQYVVKQLCLNAEKIKAFENQQVQYFQQFCFNLYLLQKTNKNLVTPSNQIKSLTVQSV